MTVGGVEQGQEERDHADGEVGPHHDGQRHPGIGLPGYYRRSGTASLSGRIRASTAA